MPHGYCNAENAGVFKKYFSVENNIARTSLANIGMILHCAPVLMNIGWIENGKVAFKYYYDGISQTVAKYIEKWMMKG